MKKNNFKQTNFENSKACYRLYVDYFKATFPYITPPIYENVQYYIERVLQIIIYDCNWTRTHNHLVHIRTLNHLAKLAKCFKQGVPRHSGNYRVWILSETRTLHEYYIYLEFSGNMEARLVKKNFQHRECFLNKKILICHYQGVLLQNNAKLFRKFLVNFYKTTRTKL